MSQQNKKKGQRFEKKCQKTINSGSLWFDKGDLKAEEHTIECKYTDKKGFRVTLSILEKLWNEALSANKSPFLIVGIKRNEKENFVIRCNLELERK